ncbi:MAG TPA: DUF808 domain-containing protein, partial [Pseudohaliea sp.]|nr:DUF808 domain-containing protein [Pseudohaliea sp.]
VNAEKVTGVRADRELPVVWAVAVGSLRNKVILVPAALLLAAFVPWSIAPLLVCGGLFLCFEGAEKLWHALAVPREAKATAHRELVERLADPAVDPRELERDKIRGAVRTDFILSAEIIVITLGIVAAKPLVTQVGVLSAIALVMTVGVYGLVAAIVKLDDAGLYLAGRASAAAQWLGRGLLAFAPWLMRTLGVVGTAAMFMVGGGILLHSAHGLEQAVGAVSARFGAAGDLLGPVLAGAAVGVIAGFVVLAVIAGGQRVFSRNAA